MHTRVTILGGGAFGTAMATLVAQNVANILIWCREEEVAASINQSHENFAFLPGSSLSPRIRATTSLQEALETVDIIFEAIPTKFLRSVLLQAKPYVKPGSIWCTLSKGIEDETLLLPSQVVEDVLVNVEVAALSGPNFAKELAQKAYAGADLAASDKVFQKILPILKTSYFIVKKSDDLIGVQLAGALKNVIALAVGVARGAEISQGNSLVLLIMEGILEIAQLIELEGGDRDVAYGLAGLGDLVLTTMGGLSRNVRAGELIGQGKSLEEVSAQMRSVPEAFNTIKSAKALQDRHYKQFPIITVLYEILFQGRSPEDLFQKAIF